MGFKTWGKFFIVLAAALLLAACQLAAPAPVVVTVVVVQATTVPPVATPTSVSLPATQPPAAVAVTQELTATVVKLLIKIGNDQTQPNATEWDCYPSDLNVGDSTVPRTQLKTGDQYEVLGKSKRTHEHVVAIHAEGTVNGVCWLSEFEITVPAGWDWTKVPVYP